jgi:predicted nucleic acid-binding protein
MIYGGTKYLKELSEVRGLAKLLTELEKQRRVEILPTTCVDSVAEEVTERVNDKRLNDEHLIAIVIVSRCRIICTDDKKAVPFIKRSDLYKKYGAKRPSIYRYATHKDMCGDKNVVEHWSGNRDEA